MWIDARAALPITAQGMLEAVEITWVFDEFYSAASVEGFDGDGDGRPDQDPMDEMVQGATADLRDWIYFTDPRLDGTRLAWGEAVTGTARWEGDRLIYRFHLPLAEPVDLSKGGTLRLYLYDPTFYISILLEERPDAVTLGGEAPPSCAVRIIEPDEGREVTIDDAIAIAEDVQPGEEGLGFGYAQTIGVRCAD